MKSLPERPEEFSPGLTPELKELIEAGMHLKENGVGKRVKSGVSQKSIVAGRKR